MGAILTVDFWTNIKLALDIVQALVFTTATIVGGIWAVKTFGYNEKLSQLEKLNRSVVNLKEALITLRTWVIIGETSGAAVAPANKSLEADIFRAQAELREAFDSSLRIDFLSKIEWSTRLVFYMYNIPSSLSDESRYKEMVREFSEVSAMIVREGHLALPKWLRYLSSCF